ncbi:Hypothetical predicted protein [Lecanosticta acicola]|uniref:Uncharacterized protein n=1 Tax=Lecanosticta acicola TaxID=111012 RepID=A0AAI9E859_9PEZI|nr:Hypothetical predicted protein [Lecanosticta acicola]
MSASSNRPIFDSVDTTFDPSHNNNSARDDSLVVESPSLTNGNALARFEFEPNLTSKNGTKVLMVEWEEDDTTAPQTTSSWEVTWENKRTVLPAREEGEEQAVNRLYFLLGPGVAIPTTVKLTKGSIEWRTNPLPAIFPPELGAKAGKKGVLHTIWAKKRLQVLTREIEAESKENAEGIGLEMAVAEKEWIEATFGVATKPPQISISAAQGATMASVLGGGNLNSPTSPRSPGGGRLLDKLKGLKIGTSESELSASRKDEHVALAAAAAAAHNPLSPESSDVAVGSFGSFAALKGAAPPPTSTLAAKPPQPPTQQQQRKMMASQRPPESFSRQPYGMGSLNAFAAGDGGLSQQQQQGTNNADDDDDDDNDNDDDLFALPMSPRSPDMTKSPFSFATKDTHRYVNGNGGGKAS